LIACIHTLEKKSSLIPAAGMDFEWKPVRKGYVVQRSGYLRYTG